MDSYESIIAELRQKNFIRELYRQMGEFYSNPDNRAEFDAWYLEHYGLPFEREK